MQGLCHSSFISIWFPHIYGKTKYNWDRTTVESSLTLFELFSYFSLAFMFCIQFLFPWLSRMNSSSFPFFFYIHSQLHVQLSSPKRQCSLRSDFYKNEHTLLQTHIHSHTPPSLFFLWFIVSYSTSLAHNFSKVSYTFPSRISTSKSKHWRKGKNTCTKTNIHIHTVKIEMASWSRNISSLLSSLLLLSSFPTYFSLSFSYS